MNRRHAELLLDFLAYWAEQVQAGRVIAFSTMQRLSLSYFADWLDKRDVDRRGEKLREQLVKTES